MAFEKYKANMRVFLGDFDRYVEKHEIVEYDAESSQLRLADLTKTYAKFLSLLKQKWFVPIQQPQESNTYELPVSSNKITPTNTGNPEKTKKSTELYTVEEDERLVKQVSFEDSVKARVEHSNSNWESNVTARTENTNNAGNFRLDDPDRKRKVMPVIHHEDEHVPVAEAIRMNKKAKKQGEILGDNDGVVVKTRKLQTSTKPEKLIIDGSTLSNPEVKVSTEFVPQESLLNNIPQEEDFSYLNQETPETTPASE